MGVDHIVKVRRPEGQWVTLGTEEARGVVPEGLSLSADLRGPSSCGFTLKRPADVIWSELQAANQVQVDVDGVPVWGGRINQTPAAGKGVGEQISVSAQGWVTHLDDDQVTLGWVRSSLAGINDSRSYSLMPLTAWRVNGFVEAGDGSCTFGWRNGTVVAPNDRVGVTLDLGANRGCRTVAWTYETSNSTSSVNVYCRGSDTAAIGGGDDAGWTGQTLTAVGASGSTSGSFTTRRRYVSWLIYNPALSGTISVDIWGRLKSLVVSSEPGFMSGGTSSLTASGVVVSALSAGVAPLVAAPDITPTSFIIPEFWPDGYRTPREIIEAVNAYHDYLWGVDALKRPYWRARPTDPLFEVGSFSGGQFDDASLGNLDRIYNRVIVEYTGPDGVPATVSRTNPSTILTRQGFTRTYRLTVQATLTAEAANQIGDVWLAKHAAAPLSGSITVAPGDIRTTQGTPVHPSVLLTKTGERLRLTGQIDPVTGAIGRVGTIVNVTYNPAAETAAVTLDNDNQSLETWLSRLAVIQGTGR